MSDFLFTSESVSEGHPDKVADQISDAVLDAILEQDPVGRVAAETLVSTGLVVMTGEISSTASVDYARVARATIRAIGYNDPELRFDADGCAVVGETCPKRLADGAAIPEPPSAVNAPSNWRATGCNGMRSPTLSWPPVTASATCAARGTISVSGPGQNAAASRRAPSGNSRAQRSTSATSARCTITG